MARIPDDQLAQLKKNVSILHVCAAHGIELKPHGTADYVGRCPLPGHEDGQPSFVVTPRKNLFHCMGCDAAGSVIDLVMKLDGLTFREAVDQLMTSTGLITRGAQTAKQKKPVPEERAQQLLDRAVTIYEKNFAEHDQARQYLESRGLTDAGLFTHHRLGYADGGLSKILPGNGNVRDELKSLGILTARGGEHFRGCLVFPVLDLDGRLTTLYGRATANGKKRHVFLPGRPTGLWNVAAIKSHSDIILVESVIDALSVTAAGLPNVIAIQGTNGLHDEDLRTFAAHGVRRLVLLLDGDDAGGRAAAAIRRKVETLPQGEAALAVTVKALPDGIDPNAYLIEHGAEALRAFLDSDAWTPDEMQPTAAAGTERADTVPSRAEGSPPPHPTSPPGGAEYDGAGFAVSYSLRRYRVLGLDKGPRKLKATVRIEHGGKLHVDTLDFYSARSRRALAQDLCRLFEATPETIEADIARLLQECERFKPRDPAAAQGRPAESFMSAKQKAEAEAFGRAPDLAAQVLADFEACGLVGEQANKLLGYLAMSSRKMPAPLSMLILSSSGAGKTALQDAVLGFCPPEDLVKLTSLSGKALFYKEQTSLKHKVLALEEGDGAEEASYAIRNLISARELVSESTIKDLATGRLTTMENRVEGPTAVFLTTTNPEIDPETKSRFFVTSIDESREQTRRILDFQRRRQTLDGLAGSREVDAILTRHRNFQRLLKPLAVVNPYADQLTYGDDRLQGRRDQPKYLSLITAVAFLRQMHKEIRHTKRDGSAVPFVVVDREDIRLANRLADEVLGKSLDELSRPSRSLLMLLDEMVEQIVKRLNKEGDPSTRLGAGEHAPRRTSLTFSRRDVREFTGWTNTRLHIHLKELVEFEYLVVETGRNGMPYRYRLAYEGQGKQGERFMLGLKDVDNLSDPDRA